MDQFSNEHISVQFISSFPGIIYWKNSQGYYLGCNQRMADMLGLQTPQACINKTIYDLLPKSCQDIAHIIDNTDNDIMKSKLPKVLEEQGCFSNGEKAFFLTTKTPLFNAASRPPQTASQLI